MDVTGIGVAAGVAVALGFAAVKALRQRTFDAEQCLVVFLGAYGAVAGTFLIRAAWAGACGALPGDWREYLAAAGVVSIGLSCSYVLRALRSAWARGDAAPSGGQNETDSGAAPNGGASAG
jgi:drug/metabolite transporter (DMT)-like permease